MSFRYVKIKPQIENVTRGMWMASCTRSVHGGFGGIWKKSVEFCLGGRRLTFPRSFAEALWQVSHVVWGRWKSQHRKNVCLSPYVKKPFNSKVIKSFVPELRSHKCFSCFEIPMFYVYMLWTFYVRFTYSCMAMLHQHLIRRQHLTCRYNLTKRQMVKIHQTYFFFWKNV